MSITAGEVVHIVKCIPIEVKFRQTDQCYLQLSIHKENETLFPTLRTHIIIGKAIETSCNIFLPAMYYVNDAWYKLFPKPTKSLPPSTMQPTTKPTWKYLNPASLAASGIYTQANLDKLRDHIMFPARKPNVLNVLEREILVHSNINDIVSSINLLDEETLNKIAESDWGKFTLIHGYALHNVFGWSIHLLGAQESTLDLQKSNPPAPQGIQTPLYTELTHTGNIRTYTESNLYPHAQLNNIIETPN